MREKYEAPMMTRLGSVSELTFGNISSNDVDGVSSMTGNMSSSDTGGGGNNGGVQD